MKLSNLLLGISLTVGVTWGISESDCYSLIQNFITAVHQEVRLFDDKRERCIDVFKELTDDLINEDGYIGHLSVRRTEFKDLLQKFNETAAMSAKLIADLEVSVAKKDTEFGNLREKITESSVSFSKEFLEAAGYSDTDTYVSSMLDLSRKQSLLMGQILQACRDDLQLLEEFKVDLENTLATDSESEAAASEGSANDADDDNSDHDL